MIALLLLALLAGPVSAETLLQSPPPPALSEASLDGALGGEPLLSVPREVAPGGVVRIIAVSPDPLDSVSVQLIDAKGRSPWRSTSFRLSRGDEGETWVALIGIPSTAAPGPRTLEVKLSSGSKDSLLRAELSVPARAFSAEAIALDNALSTLRTALDQRKTDEARNLARLLGVAHGDALFATETVRAPISVAWRRTGGYGDRREYKYAGGGADTSVHNGIDMAAPEKTPVSACARGRVVFAGDRIVTGKTVVIEHLPGVFSIYYHMASVLVREGDLLAGGAAIGSVGKTGLATGPHLHWEVQILGTAVDPEALVGRAVLDKGPFFLDIRDEKKPEGR
jgi:murein DD-endopeptidase MepM/ murein hydrolase activator NlpD